VLFSYHCIERTPVRLEGVTVTATKSTDAIKKSIFESESEGCGVQEYEFCIVGYDRGCPRKLDELVIEAPMPNEIRGWSLRQSRVEQR
jgi:hypothetical protein